MILDSDVRLKYFTIIDIVSSSTRLAKIIQLTQFSENLTLISCQGKYFAILCTMRKTVKSNSGTGITCSLNASPTGLQIEWKNSHECSLHLSFGVVNADVCCAVCPFNNTLSLWRFS